MAKSKKASFPAPLGAARQLSSLFLFLSDAAASGIDCSSYPCVSVGEVVVLVFIGVDKRIKTVGFGQLRGATLPFLTVVEVTACLASLFTIPLYLTHQLLEERRPGLCETLKAVVLCCFCFRLQIVSSARHCNISLRLL